LKISKTAVHRPVATAMVFIAISVVGIFAFTRLQIDLFPELDFPSISVVTSYPGVGPEEMETLVTRPIESAVARVEGIDRLESFSSEGRSRVALRFDWGVDLDTALNDVRAAVERVKGSLPEDADDPIIFKFDLASFPIMYLALDADMDEGRLQRFAEETVKPRLERVTGVASADVSGVREREIHVEIDPEKLAGLDLGPEDVVAAISAENPTVPTGLVADGRENVLVRAMGQFEDVDEIRNATVAERNGHAITVEDVAEVQDAFEDYENIVRINGQRGVSLRIIKSPAANTVEVADRLQEEIERFNEEYHGRANLSVVVDTSTFIRRSIVDVQNSVLIGAGLAFVVLLLFLRSFRSTLVIAVSIPISVIATMWLMYQLDLTLNLITFGGIAIGVGMLVDNSIVILENIYRRREMGDDAEEAAIRGSREVGTAIVASTMTTLAVFVPVIFLGGFTAVFFGQMTLVVASALVCSLLVALTLVPMLASLLLRGMDLAKQRETLGGRFFRAMDDGYRTLVGHALRWAIVIVPLAVGALWYTTTYTDEVGTELLPESDESEVRLFARYPSGTRIEETDAATRRIEAIIEEEVPEAEMVMTTLGTPGFWSTSGEESARMRINLVPVEERERSSEEVAADLSARLRGEIPGMRIFARPGGGLWIFRFIRGGDARVRVDIRGHDIETADALAKKIAGIVSSTEGVTDAQPSRRKGGRELRLFVDRDKAAELGMTTRQIANVVSTLTQGTRAGVYRERGDEFAIRVRLAETDLESLQGLLATPVSLPKGRSVQLADLVVEDDGETPQAIERLNQDRIVTISGGIDESRPLGAINEDIQAELRKLEFPEGFSARVVGEEEQQKDSFESLGLGLILALLLVYMVMAGQFESLIQPLIILVSVPFAGIGVILTLLWTETTFNLNSFLGVIVLVGVVVNNAIVLVDYINMMRREGTELREAVLESARRRLRPILMTTATTVLALLPVAIGSGTGGETQAPLARVVVGGMLSSTLISLLIVPILYYWVARAGEWVRTTLRRRRQTVADAQAS